MKKIISLIAAVSMACSVLATSAFAIDTTAPVIKSTTTQLTNEEFYEFYEEDIPEGQVAYMVSFDVTNLADSLKYSKTAGTNAKPKFSGNALDTFEVILSTTDDMSVINQDYSYIINHALSMNPTESFDDGMWQVNYFGNFVYPAAKDIEGVEDGSTVDFIQMCFVVDEGAVVSFDTEGSMSILNYVDSAIKGQVDYSNVTDTNLTFSPATIVLGEEKPDDGKGTEVKKDGAVIGTVWNNVVFEDVANTAYNLIFTDAEGNVKPGEGDIDFGELSGDVTVAVILNSARAGVKLQVVPVE